MSNERDKNLIRRGHALIADVLGYADRSDIKIVTKDGATIARRIGGLLERGVSEDDREVAELINTARSAIRHNRFVMHNQYGP